MQNVLYYDYHEELQYVHVHVLVKLHTCTCICYCSFFNSVVYVCNFQVSLYTCTCS